MMAVVERMKEAVGMPNPFEMVIRSGVHPRAMGHG